MTLVCACRSCNELPHLPAVIVSLPAALATIALGYMVSIAKSELNPLSKDLLASESWRMDSCSLFPARHDPTSRVAVIDSIPRSTSAASFTSATSRVFMIYTVMDILDVLVSGTEHRSTLVSGGEHARSISARWSLSIRDMDRPGTPCRQGHTS